MRWQYEQLVADTVRTWIEREVPDAEDGWADEAEYAIVAMKRPGRWWTVAMDIPVSSGVMRVEVFVGEGGTARVVGARRPGRGQLRGKVYLYDQERGWYEDAEPAEPTPLRMV